MVSSGNNWCTFPTEGTEGGVAVPVLNSPPLLLIGATLPRFTSIMGGSPVYMCVKFAIDRFPAWELGFWRVRPMFNSQSVRPVINDLYNDSIRLGVPSQQKVPRVAEPGHHSPSPLPLSAPCYPRFFQRPGVGSMSTSGVIPDRVLGPANG